MKKIDGIKLKEVILSGVNNLYNNKERIDTLNVFPVPDGDTGSNMGSTADYAGEQIISLNTKSVAEVSAKFARGMLMGARGNSGVILSQIFKGISAGFEGKTEATSFDVVEAFKQAKEYAYKSVMTPIEGTILTVIRLVAENLEKTVTPADTIEQTFAYAYKFAREATDSTPELLPVLKEVGVVDSGGEGLTVMLEGIKEAFEGKPVNKGQAAKGDFGSFQMDDGEDYDGEFGYCTEFILELKIPSAFDKAKFEKALTRFGNSLVVVHDEDIVKVHVHTRRPGDAMTFALKFGQFIKVKVDNMTLQANESNSVRAEKAEESKTTTSAIANETKNSMAVISCNTGQGIIDDMIELGTNYIIEAGQSENPSAKDFADAIEETGADKIIILPNNSNIILAAQQVAQTSDKEIIVVPSKTQMQGLSAMLNFDPEGTLVDNQENMEEAISSVKTGQITKAARSTKIEGVSVREGEYLAIAEKKILESTPSKVKSAISVSKKLITEDTEIVTIYYGDDSTETDAEEVASFIEMNYDVDVEVKDGDQQIYNFLIAYE